MIYSKKVDFETKSKKRFRDAIFQGNRRIMLEIFQDNEIMSSEDFFAEIDFIFSELNSNFDLFSDEKMANLLEKTIEILKKGSFELKEKLAQKIVKSEKEIFFYHFFNRHYKNTTMIENLLLLFISLLIDPKSNDKFNKHPFLSIFQDILIINKNPKIQEKVKLLDYLGNH